MSNVYYNECGIIIRDSVVEDIESLKDRLKESDIQEVWASYHLTPEEALKYSLENSSFSLTVEKDGIPIIIFGITPEVWLGDKAVVWLLSTEVDRSTKILFLRNSKKFIDLLLSFYPYLYNYVDVRNTSSIQWLKFCGAEFSEPVNYGKDQLLFNFFSIERK